MRWPLAASWSFRSIGALANEGAYPLALADINYAIRWTKLHAKELKTRPDLVGISGQSSGGHLAMLAAMRPHDPRYTAIALPAGSPALDATVKAAVLSWPVINPLGRYRFAKRQGALPNPPAWPPGDHRQAPAVLGRRGRT